MGLTLTVTCLTEVPVFHFQPQLLKLVSVHTMLNIVMWTYMLRMGLYALLPYTGSAWAVLPVELLHGVTFGCGWSAGTITSKRVAPPGLEATMQGIFQGLYFGVGQGLGALIGGLLKQRHGGQAMFALCSGIVLAGWLLCVVAEQATLHLGKAGAHCSSGSHGSILDSLQQPWRQLQQGAPAAAAGRLRALLRKLRGRFMSDSVGVTGSDTTGWSLPASIKERLRQQKYAELASKDSGPDLQRYWQGCGVDAVNDADMQ
ncbi:hypothetical protein COO60DRAFT_1128185 [Scenedesmus sp. NREL 46B-D3]|nr:hypothetical protein COO60DRAFT_1128185 [Scenedesmus sp. NREL 46B-D3]